MVGINCVVLGGEVVITDRVVAAVDLIKKNLSLNNVNSTVLPLDWNKLQEFPDTSFDLIIGSDVLYQSRNAEGITKLLTTKHLKDGGLSIIFCPGRGYASRLESLCNETNELKASAYFLYNVDSENCKMPELHIVAIKKGDLSSKNQTIFQQLKEFVKKHGWEEIA